MSKILLTACLIITVFSVLTKAQANKSERIFICSWESSKETIMKQAVRIILDSESMDYKTEIIGTSGKRYVLSAIHNPIKNLKADHWRVELREIKYQKDYQEVLGDNLLAQTRFDPDSFSSREEFISYFYPNEEKIININGVPRIVASTNNNSQEITPFYSVKATRKITIGNFSVTLKAGNYIFDGRDKNKVKTFEIFVEFEELSRRKTL